MADTKTKPPEQSQAPAPPPAVQPPPPAPQPEPCAPRAMQDKLDRLAAKYLAARRRQQVAPAEEMLATADSPEQQQRKLDAKAARLEKANEEVNGLLNKIKELRPAAEAMLVGIRIHFHEKGSSGTVLLPGILTKLGIDGTWDLLTLNSLRHGWVHKQKKPHADAATPGHWTFMPNGVM